LATFKGTIEAHMTTREKMSFKPGEEKIRSDKKDQKKAFVQH